MKREAAEVKLCSARLRRRERHSMLRVARSPIALSLLIHEELMGFAASPGGVASQVLAHVLF